MAYCIMGFNAAYDEKDIPDDSEYWDMKYDRWEEERELARWDEESEGKKNAE